MELRFLKFIKIDRKSLCWNYSGDKTPEGYGRFYLSNPKKIFLAHRFSYQIFNGELIDTLVIDHICMNKSCVNPEHLRQVDRRINVLENSKGLAFYNSLKTHCKLGHEYTKENTFTSDGRVSKQGVRWRTCKICVQATKRRNYEKYREKYIKNSRNRREQNRSSILLK